MRILHILDHSVPLHSAYSHRTLSLLTQQRARGWHTIHLTGPAQGKVETPDRNGDRWHFFRTDPACPALALLPPLQQAAIARRMARRLRHAVKLTRPDILHVHPPALNALAALRIGRLFALPVLVELRAAGDDALAGQGAPASGLRPLLARALETYVARRADAVVTSCGGMRRELLARGVCGDRLSVIPPAVSMRHAAPRERPDPAFARSLGLGSGPVIGYIGPLHEDEGLALLMAAMPSLLRAHPGLQLLLAGAGPAEPALRTRAAALGAAVVFAGRVPRERIGKLHALLDLLVYPRLALPLAELVSPHKPLEALAHGALVAASNVGGHRELIEHGKNGVLFEAGSTSALADAVLALLAEPACWAPLRERARRFAVAERSWAAIAARYAPIYTRLIEGR